MRSNPTPGCCKALASPGGGPTVEHGQRSGSDLNPIRRVSAGFAIRRVVLAIAVGLIAGAVAAIVAPWQAAVLLGWDAAVVVFGARVWLTILPMSALQTKRHAVREDPSLVLADSVVVGAAVACLVGVGLILVKAAHSGDGMKAFLFAIGVVSIILSWGAVHTIFTLQYARLYYSGPDGGVNFHEPTPPDYPDFAYLAFTIGMTFQVSDTDLTSKAVRRTALRHALISYLFGVVIIGLVINVVASLIH